VGSAYMKTAALSAGAQNAHRGARVHSVFASPASRLGVQPSARSPSWRASVQKGPAVHPPCAPGLEQAVVSNRIRRSVDPHLLLGVPAFMMLWALALPPDSIPARRVESRRVFELLPVAEPAGRSRLTHYLPVILPWVVCPTRLGAAGLLNFPPRVASKENRAIRWGTQWGAA